jgi:hypothetical protein
MNFNLNHLFNIIEDNQFLYGQELLLNVITSATCKSYFFT